MDLFSIDRLFRNAVSCIYRDLSYSQCCAYTRALNMKLKWWRPDYAVKVEGHLGSSHWREGWSTAWATNTTGANAWTEQHLLLLAALHLLHLRSFRLEDDGGEQDN